MKRNIIKYGILTMALLLFAGCSGGLAVNFPPEAIDDNTTTVENVAVTFNIQTNDFPFGGTIVSQSFETQPAHGVVSSASLNGVITYTPNANYSGTDSFTYKLEDNDGLSSNVATVNIVIDADTDADGIGNATDEDDDNDGLTDVEEATYGSDPLNVDSDGDGINDLNETILDTNLTNADTDGDGVDDGVEVGNGTNPLNTDTDGDGLLDGVEGTTDADNDGILDALESNTTDTDSDGVPDQVDDDNLNPNNDTDSDGISNSEETEQGTDPQNIDTDGDGIADGIEAHIDTDGDGIIDALESNTTDTDGDGIVDQEDAGNDDPNIGAFMVADACAELTEGAYAYEGWRSYNATADDAFVGDSQLKEMKINASNVIHLKEDEYTSASAFTNSMDSAQAGWIGSPAENFILDVSNMTRQDMGRIGLFPNNKVGCANNVASFTGYNGLSSYDIHLSELNISGSYILDHYADLEVEINDDINNKTKTFPAGSKKLLGHITLTSDHYLMEADSDTVVTDGTGASMATVNFTLIQTTGHVLVFNSDRKMTLANDGTFTFIQQDGSSIANGTWQVLGTAPNQYIKTTGSAEDADSGEIFFAVVAGKLRFGEFFPIGWTLHIGTEPDDIMDEVMFNKVGMEGIQDGMNTPIQLLKKTGQTKSYDASGVQVGNDSVADGLLKDDGYYQKGVTPNYTRDAGTEIVTDHITGLQWQDDAAVATVTKPWVTQTHYDAGDYNNTSGDTATGYCASLILGSFNDWRLPNIVELRGIVDYGSSSPFIDATFINNVPSAYWSSTVYAGNNSNAWFVYFGDGNLYNDSKSNSLYVRCVRAGQ